MEAARKLPGISSFFLHFHFSSLSLFFLFIFLPFFSISSFSFASSFLRRTQVRIVPIIFLSFGHTSQNAAHFSPSFRPHFRISLSLRNLILLGGLAGLRVQSGAQNFREREVFSKNLVTID